MLYLTSNNFPLSNLCPIRCNRVTEPFTTTPTVIQLTLPTHLHPSPPDSTANSGPSSASLPTSSTAPSLSPPTQPTSSPKMPPYYVRNMTTDITGFADDDAFWPGTLLKYVLTSFEDQREGGRVGTSQPVQSVGEKMTIWEVLAVFRLSIRRNRLRHYWGLSTD
ncbi:hypothetical protein EV360DRAFT_87706 [Lentinula raphanica]|nr:hypothetical protein EV360DRAFT_87706 [Lentinula raphanica]